MDEDVGELILFGSSLHSLNPNDLDLALIYYESICSIETALKIRQKFEHQASTRGLLPVHILLLNTSESTECDFLGSVNGVNLKKWMIDHDREDLKILVKSVEDELRVKFL